MYKKGDNKIRFFYWVHQASVDDMKKIIDIKEKQIYFIVDNSAVHWSKETKCYLKKTNWSWLFLPQYTPELALVELFFCQLKRLVSSRNLQSIINLDKIPGRKLIADIISSIGQATIMRTWSHFFWKLKELMTELVTIFKLSS